MFEDDILERCCALLGLHVIWLCNFTSFKFIACTSTSMKTCSGHLEYNLIISLYTNLYTLWYTQVRFEEVLPIQSLRLVCFIVIKLNVHIYGVQTVLMLNKKMNQHVLGFERTEEVRNLYVPRQCLQQTASFPLIIHTENVFLFLWNEHSYVNSFVRKR